MPNITATEVLADIDAGIKRLAARHTASLQPIVDAALAQLFVFVEVSTEDYGWPKGNETDENKVTHSDD